MKNTNRFLLILAVILSLITGCLFFQNRNLQKDNARVANAIEASQDTLHTYKSKYNSQAGYISTINGTNKELESLLTIKGKENQELITLLNTNKTLVNAVDVKTETKYRYISDVDTVYKGLSFTRVLQDDEWITESIKVDSNKLSRDLNYRDRLIMHSDKKDNKGWFTGSTLTTYAEPMNPNTKVTGLTSISTVVDKRKPRLGSFLGPSLSIDRQGNVRAGISLGVGITF